MDSQIGQITYAPPNSLGEAFVAPAGGGTTVISTVSTLYTMTNVGDLLYLNPDSGIVNTAQMPTLSNVAFNTTGIVYTSIPSDTTIISNNVEIPSAYNFAHNPENNTTFPTHTINANLVVGQPSVIPNANPDVQFYPTSFAIGDPVRVARSINLYSGALGTTITSVTGVNVEATAEVNVNAGGVLALDGGADVTINSVGAMELTSGGAMTLNAIGLTELGGGDVTINSVNRQDNTTGNTNITCSAFTAQMGGVNITAGVMAVEAGAFDLVSLAGFGFQGAGPVSFTTAGPITFSGGDATFATTSLASSNVIVSTINGLPYSAGSSGSNWSVYPATTSVNMANYTMSNIGSAIGTVSQFGTALAGQTLTTALTCYTDAYIGSNLYISSINAQNSIASSNLSAQNAIVSTIMASTAQILKTTASTIQFDNAIGINALISTINTSTFTTNTALMSQLNGFPISQYNNNNWSLKPAISMVDLNSNYMSNVLTIYTDSVNSRIVNSISSVNTAYVNATDTINCSTLNISTINGQPYSPDTGPPTTWSQYPALQNVSMGNKGFINVGQLSYWYNDPVVTNGRDSLFTDLMGGSIVTASQLLQTTGACSTILQGPVISANGYTLFPTVDVYSSTPSGFSIQPTASDLANHYYIIQPAGSDFYTTITITLNEIAYGNWYVVNGLPVGGNNMYATVNIVSNGSIINSTDYQLNPGQNVCITHLKAFGGTQAYYQVLKTPIGISQAGFGG